MALAENHPRVGPRRRRVTRRVVLATMVLLLALVALAQAFFPSLAAKRVRSRVARYGSVESVSLSAFPAIELLWGHADSVVVHAGSLSISPSQIASLLEEARGVSRLTITANAVTLRATGLPGGLTIGDVHVQKRGSSVSASGLLTQAQLDAALPSGFRVEPLGSEDDGVLARASGGFFGVRASLNVLLKPVEGQLLAEPQGLPFLASLATVTLFSDSHLAVDSLGLSVAQTNPLAFAVSLVATVH